MFEHYIRLQEGLIIKGFSTAFEPPLETDICISQHAGRHFEIEGKINPFLFDDEGLPKYKYAGGAIVQATEADLIDLREAIQAAEENASPTIEELQEEIEALLALLMGE